jgi:putative ABC transport system permease protein
VNPSLIPILAALAGGALITVGWQAARRPLQRRFAIRDLTRRPGEAALVIAGSLLGTALITGSFIVGDTLDASVSSSAWSQLGPVDETVTVSDSTRARDVEHRLASIRDERVEDVMSMVITPASIATSSSRNGLAEPGAQIIELDFRRAHDFGGDPAATGIKGDTPGEGETAITEDLAKTLRVKEGESIAAYLYGARVELEIKRILPRRGLAGFWTGFESTSPNAFVAPGTIERAAKGDLPEGAVRPAITIVVSNQGGVEDGAKLTGEVVPLLEGALGENSASLDVGRPKQLLLDTAHDVGTSFGRIFLAFSAFAVIAGILLLINIFVMLGEERKGQLGMLRAVGMRRADLVRVFVIEGLVYSLIAGLLGAALGIAVGWVIANVAAPMFSEGDLAFDITFSAQFASIVGGFLIGLLISIATVTLASVRIARINIIRAIRDLPEPSVKKARRVTLVFGIVGAVLAAAATLNSLGDDGAWAIAILGPPVALFGLLPLLARFLGHRVAVIIVPLLSLLWGIFGNALTGDQFYASGQIGAFVLQGVLVTFAAVLFLNQTGEAFAGAVRRLAARNVALRLSVAYPLARRFRTGVTLSMYSLVIFTMVFIAVFAHNFSGQVDTVRRQEAGGFDVLATAGEANPPTAEAISSIDAVERVATLTHGTALFRPDGAHQPKQWLISGIDKELVTLGPPELDQRAAGFANDADVYQQLLQDPSTAVVDACFLLPVCTSAPPVQLGETMTVIDPVSGTEVERKVIGMSASTLGLTGNGVLMSHSSVKQLLAERAAPTRFYVKTESSAAPDEVAADLQGEFVENGLDADSFRAVAVEGSSFTLQFLRLIQGYLALGLLVGIAGLGVVMVRAVRERRREVGVLRSLGLIPSGVARAFLLESGFIALQGLAIGSALALITSAALMANGDLGENVAFKVPLLQIVALCLFALAASLAATALPARGASRIQPAVSLRIAD